MDESSFFPLDNDQSGGDVMLSPQPKGGLPVKEGLDQLFFLFFGILPFFNPYSHLAPFASFPVISLYRKSYFFKNVSSGWGAVQE